MDALQLPTILNIASVPAVPKEMLEKALWYIDHWSTNVYKQAMPVGEDDAPIDGYFFLRKDNKTGVKKLDKRLLQMWEASAEGREDHRIKDLEHLADVALSIQL